MSSASSGRRAPGRGWGEPRGRRRVHVLPWLLLAALAFAVLFVGGLLAAPVNFTVPAPQRPTLLVDRSGRPFGEIQAPQQREVVPADQIPEVMRQAIVAAEDKRFLSHAGVDPSAVVRATLADLTHRGSEGGSTITQQYVKNVFVGNQHSLLRKVREAALSIRLEERLSKQEILTRYLNEVYFGQGAYGVQAASKYYFGIPAKDLSLSEASMLAGIVPAPSAYNPVTDLAKARERQKYVLNRMVESGYLTSEQASGAFATPPPVLGRAEHKSVPQVAPQYYALVAAQVKQKYAAQQDVLYKSGLEVQTSLDLDWQAAANQALAGVLPGANDPEAAVIAIDYRTGDILALADKVPAGSQFDPATLAQRTSGSTIKPFTLAVALQSGMTLDTYRYGPVVKRYPQATCPNQGSTYEITNDEGGGGGYTLRSALAQSVNTVYGPLAIDVGRAKVADLAKSAGLLRSVTPRDTVCSMGLGVTVRPIDEAVAYATLADAGVRHDPRFLLGAKVGVGPSGEGGTPIFGTDPAPAGTPAVPPDVDSQVVEAMRDVVRDGTATAAQQPDGLDVFGKTGTTDNYTDAWFSGCVPAYHACLITWMGYDRTVNPDGSAHGMLNVEGVPKVQGGTLPAAIFARTMDAYRAHGAPAPPPVPASSSAPAPPAPPAPVRPPPPPALPATPTTSRPPTSTPPASSTAPATSAPPKPPTTSATASPSRH